MIQLTMKEREQYLEQQSSKFGQKSPIPDKNCFYHHVSADNYEKMLYLDRHGAPRNITSKEYHAMFKPPTAEAIQDKNTKEFAEAGISNTIGEIPKNSQKVSQTVSGNHTNLQYRQSVLGQTEVYGLTKEKVEAALTRNSKEFARAVFTDAISKSDIKPLLAHSPKFKAAVREIVLEVLAELDDTLTNETEK